MTDLTVSARFTKSGILGPGEPATGLTLSDISLWMTQVDRATGAETVVWDGTQNPTSEIDNVGAYIRIYTAADLDQYNYFATARYNGIETLDQHWINGAAGVVSVPLGTATDFPYQVVEADLTPIDGVKVEIHRNAAGTDVIWVGYTDMLGFARDQYGFNPRLDSGTYYFFRFKTDVKFPNPDTEDVP